MSQNFTGFGGGLFVGTLASDPSTGTARAGEFYWNSTLNTFREFNPVTVAWQNLGSGSGSGGINYILNPDAETTTTGWATYSNSASNRPTNGTGGVVTNLTFSRTTTNPLVGTASFLLQQGNTANIQGEGLSYDFTIDSAYQASVLGISFNFNASSTFQASDGITPPLNDGSASTNSGNSDLEVFIYDKTNAVLIPVTPQVIAAKGTDNFVFSGTFQTNSNSTSYRFILHVPTNNANPTGWSFKFDNVIVGPISLVQGAPVLDTRNDLPFAVSAGFGTVTNSDFRYERTGDVMCASGFWMNGTVSGSNAYIQLPSGFTIDTNKISTASNGQIVGIIWRVANGGNFAGTGPGPWPLFFDGSTTNQIFVSQSETSSTLSKVAVNSIFGTGDGVHFSFRVPITAWASNVVMSNDTDTRVVLAKYYASTTSTPGLNLPFNFDTKIDDTHSAVTTGASWKFTAPVSGKYIVEYYARSAAAGAFDTRLYLNGSVIQPLVTSDVNGDDFNGSTSISLTAGDFIDLRPDTAGGSIEGNGLGVFPYLATISIFRISGPATIAASELVAADAYLSTNTAFSSTFINFDTVVFDTHGAITTGAGWKFTAPISGTYEISAAAGAATTTASDIVLYKNASAQRVVFYMFGSTSADNSSGSTLIQLTAGDYIQLKTTAAATLIGGTGGTQYTFVSIHRIGT